MQMGVFLFMSMTELGWDDFPGFCAGPRLQFARFLISLV